MNFDMTALTQQLLIWTPQLVPLIGFWMVWIITKMTGRAMDRAGLDRDV